MEVDSNSQKYYDLDHLLTRDSKFASEDFEADEGVKSSLLNSCVYS